MKKQKGCIAIFAKTPGLSALKTRLAKDIGTEEAERIYISCVDAVQDRLVVFHETNPDWDVVWALGEEKGSTHEFWVMRPFNKICTGAGDLGARLYHIDTKLKETYQHVILMGTDCPHIPMSFFDKACYYLSNNNQVVGPSTDGGYYLFGSSYIIERDIWNGVPYSQENTLEEFVKLLDTSKDLKYLDTLTDLDEVGDAALILNEAKKFQQNLSEHYIDNLKLMKAN